ncbi:MAG TPA: glycosyltransferase family 4 protein, partial [Candidatus Sulfomarinibacteraceae bacterium]|nr:glycosyltransferase family 4 protein [Candidatus Sulfomarinibacteraceae bacterium]
MIARESGNDHQKMRVAYLFQAPGLRFSDPQAAQLHIYYTLRGLQKRGHDAALLALQGQNVLYSDDIVVFREENAARRHLRPPRISNSRPFLTAERAARRLQKTARLPYLALFDSFRLYQAGRQFLSGYDLLHERFNLLATGGAWASRRLGIPYVLEVNADLLQQRKVKGDPLRGLRRWVAQWSTRFCFNSAAIIISVSPQLTRHLERGWGVSPSQLATLPCAADTELFGANGQPDQVRQQLGLNGEPIVMWVGGFYPWHSLDLLIDSFSHVAAQVPGAKLVLVGDGETRPQIEQRVQELGLRNALVMVGAVPHRQVPDLMSIADVVVAPAPALGAEDGGTGTPLKLFEYMAAGKAIVATAVNQAETIIEDGRTGILVAPGNDNAFAAAITHLLNDPQKRQQLGQNARRQAEERYSWDAYVMQLEKIY